MKCCVCEKVYNEDDVFELQEFLHIAFIGGYGSVFGDMSRVEGSVCQHCLKDKLGECLSVGGDWMGHWAKQSGEQPTLVNQKEKAE